MISLIFLQVQGCIIYIMYQISWVLVLNPALSKAMFGKIKYQLAGPGLKSHKNLTNWPQGTPAFTIVCVCVCVCVSVLQPKIN